MKLRVGMLIWAGTLLWVHSSHTATVKRRLCIEYVVEDARHNFSILAAFENVTGAECLKRCARHTDCYAYNFLRTRGTCEILRGVGACGEITGRFDGSKYVHLGACKRQQPWLIGVKNWTTGASCQMWHRHMALSGERCPAGMVTDPDGRACVALIPNKGLYLPGWYAGIYRVITEDAEPMWCHGYGYILRVVPECPVSWQSYTVGDPIPSAAVTASIWKDGTPLYIVRKYINTNWYIGYMLSSVPRSYIRAGVAYSPTDVHILVYIWSDGNISIRISMNISG